MTIKVKRNNKWPLKIGIILIFTIFNFIFSQLLADLHAHLRPDFNYTENLLSWFVLKDRFVM